MQTGKVLLSNVSIIASKETTLGNSSTKSTYHRRRVLSYFPQDYSCPKKILFSLLAASVLLPTLQAEDLGTITIDSTTIDDKYASKKTEVSNVMVITKEEIEKINPKSLIDILKTIPGITAAESDTDSVKVHIRGVDNQMYMGEQPGVAVVIDGVPVQETAGKINVDLDNIESVKVIKGGASYLYGNDAIGGAVIITTKRAKAQNYSKVEVEGGTFGSSKILATTNQSFEKSSLQIQASKRETDGYWDDAYVRTKSINGKYQYYINETSDITFGLDYSYRKTGDGSSVTGVTQAATNPTAAGVYSYAGYYDTKLFKSFITYSKDISDTSNFMTNIYKYKDSKNSYTNRLKNYNDEVWDQTGIKSEYRTSFDSLALLGGFDIQRNKVDANSITVATGAIRSDSTTSEEINALYGEAKYQITSDLTTTLNARFDNIKYDLRNRLNTAYDVRPEYNVGSYRLGAAFLLSDKDTLYASFATGFRAPTASSISSNLQLLLADPTRNLSMSISPETTYNFELGVRGSEGILDYDFSFYQLDRKDYIGKIAGSYITSDDGEESGYANVGDMRNRGMELALHSRFNEIFTANLAYTFLDARFTRYWISQQLTDDGDNTTSDETFQRVDLSGNVVPRTSRHTINLSTDIHLSSALTITPEFDIKSSYYADEVNKFKMGGYTLANVRAEYKASDSLEYFAKIDNFFDKKYYLFAKNGSSALATDEDMTIRVGAPRAFYVGMRYKF